MLHTRARAILNGAGKPAEAIESAYAAVQLDPTDAFYLLAGFGLLIAKLVSARRIG